MKTNEPLARYAVQCAMRAAARYIDTHSVVIDDMDALAESIRNHVMAAWGPALDDARLAIDCHMDHAAMATFDASMAMAGISAVKSVADAVTQ